MKKEKRPTIAILMGEFHNEYLDDLLQGFYACAKEEHINLIFLMRFSLPRYHDDVLSDVIGDDYQIQFCSIYNYPPLVKPDALIIAYGTLCILPGAPDKKSLLSYLNTIPCLFFEDVSDDPKVPYLVADNYEGMYKCLKHLIVDHGYRKIALLNGPKHNRDAKERMQAYLDIMAEYGCPVTDTMIAYGDYTEIVDDKVEYLLDNNPGLEAIAFANDDMAKAGYRVCDARGLIVGSDLAITGFDDVDIAKTMTPPLTSISHNSFSYSYRALQNALLLCKGEEIAFNIMPSSFRRRNSCGCFSESLKLSSRNEKYNNVYSYVHDTVSRISENLFLSIPYKEEQKLYNDLLVAYFDHVLDAITEASYTQDSFDSVIPYLKKLCEYPHISIRLTLEYIIQLLQDLAFCAPNEYSRSSLLSVVFSTQQYVHSREILKFQSDLQSNLHRNWFVSSFTQDLLSSRKSLEESLSGIMNRLQLMQVKSTYFFLHHELADYRYSEGLQSPEALYLAAYCNETETVCLAQNEWIPVTEENGLASFLPEEDSHIYTTYVLFSGEEQYGLLLCEHSLVDTQFLLACSLQIGSFLHFYKLNTTEHKIKQELQNSLNLIQEQNNILNFISDYDELTRLLNRRGFMEETLQAIKDNQGKRAYLLFADLDHLKEINDCFGHAAGDFAIQTAAKYLCHCLPEGSIVARIGGDEFVSFIVTEETDFQPNIMTAIKDYTASFNQSSGKNFYVEMSVGIYECQCDSLTSISELLKRSDEILYQEKQHRRASIKK